MTDISTLLHSFFHTANASARNYIIPYSPVLTKFPNVDAVAPVQATLYHVGGILVA